MIVANQEIAVHIKLIKNLSHYTSARYSIRFCIYTQNNNRRIYATPVNIIESVPSQSQNRSEFDQHYYITKSFPLKSTQNIEINEICIFKNNLDVFQSSEDYNQCSLHLTCEIIMQDHQKPKIVGCYNGCLRGTFINEFLQMDFYENAPCQVIGSIHSIAYKFQFHNKDQSTTNLTNYCQKYCANRENQIINYLFSQCKKNNEKIQEILSQITEEKPQVITLNKAKSQDEEKDIAERETQIDQDIKMLNLFQNLDVKKKRRKIFCSSKEDQQKYASLEKTMHESAQIIYQNWRVLIKSLFLSDGINFLKNSEITYCKKLKEKIGQSLVRFKGSWDMDMYHDQESLRNNWAHKLRNQNQQILKEQEVDSRMFSVYNEDFFSKTRPIFFEETAINYQSKVKQFPKQNETFIILVHGLGACRLDMEKLRIELRRYYDSKVKIFSSSANEGRTEGDIDQMGLRLATEIQFELSKFANLPQICFIGHSMGGLIIRSALPRLEKYRKYFYSYLTLSSPHLGYTYSTSKLVDAGLWLMNTMKKCQSILQLTMQDSEVIEDTFLYKLSKKKGLQWFKKVSFLASHQDLYVPYYSARVQKHEDSKIDLKKGVKKGIIYNEMVDSILNQVKGTITRFNVNFCIPQQNIDNLIGRAAHISFINNIQMLRTFVNGAEHCVF